MAYTSAYTLREAQEHLALWKECFRALAEGQAKSYRVGTREFTALDLDEVRKTIEWFKNEVDLLEGNSRTTRVRCVIPRDL